MLAVPHVIHVPSGCHATVSLLPDVRSSLHCCLMTVDSSSTLLVRNTVPQPAALAVRLSVDKWQSCVTTVRNVWVTISEVEERVVLCSTRHLFTPPPSPNVALSVMSMWLVAVTTLCSSVCSPLLIHPSVYLNRSLSTLARCTAAHRSVPCLCSAVEMQADVLCNVLLSLQGVGDK